jgi:hypothetical protein
MNAPGAERPGGRRAEFSVASAAQRRTAGGGPYPIMVAPRCYFKSDSGLGPVAAVVVVVAWLFRNAADTARPGLRAGAGVA